MIALEPADESDPGRALAQRTVASSWEESTRGRIILSARPGSHVRGGCTSKAEDLWTTRLGKA